MQDIVLKILSGPMFGVDVWLPDESVHLFFCDSENIEITHTGSVYQHALNTLLIPCVRGANEKILLRLMKSENIDQAGPDGEIEVTAQCIPLDSVDEGALDADVAADNDAQEEQTDTAPEDNTTDGEVQRYAVISVPLNQPVSIGHAVIALKYASDEWSKEVSQYSYPLPLQDNDGVEKQSPALTLMEQKRPSLFKLAA